MSVLARVPDPDEMPTPAEMCADDDDPRDLARERWADQELARRIEAQTQEFDFTALTDLTEEELL